jgi:hypothetical protein
MSNRLKILLAEDDPSLGLYIESVGLRRNSRTNGRACDLSGVFV